MKNRDLPRFDPRPAVFAEVARYAPEFLPGAVDLIVARHWRAVCHMRPCLMAEKVAEIVALPEWSGFRDPRFKPSGSSLRRALERHGLDLKAGDVSRLAKLWAVDLAGLSAPKLAGEVVRRLADPQHRRTATARPGAVPKSKRPARRVQVAWVALLARK